MFETCVRNNSPPDNILIPYFIFSVNSGKTDKPTMKQRISTICSLKLGKSIMLMEKANEKTQQERPQQCQESRLSFSIDRILENDKEESKVQYDWLSYTRYRPPKLQSKHACRKRYNVTLRHPSAD